jgi:hypothetical protein
MRSLERPRSSPSKILDRNPADGSNGFTGESSRYRHDRLQWKYYELRNTQDSPQLVELHFLTVSVLSHGIPAKIVSRDTGIAVADYIKGGKPL